MRLAAVVVTRHVSCAQGAAASAQKGELKGAAAAAARGERIGGHIPIGEKSEFLESRDPDYVPKPGEQATQEELAGADYESGAVKGPLHGAPARNVERQVRLGCSRCMLASSSTDAHGAQPRTHADGARRQRVGSAARRNV